MWVICSVMALIRSAVDVIYSVMGVIRSVMELIQCNGGES